MTEIRRLTGADARAYYECMKTLDQQTKFMMYEPDEREWDEDSTRSMLDNPDILVLGACDGEKIIGVLAAERGTFRRMRHYAYIIVGIHEGYRHQGIGRRLFEACFSWAEELGLTRLELTVEVPNEAAFRLYRKMGFEVEGTKIHTMIVDGTYVDEYTMAKLL